MEVKGLKPLYFMSLQESQGSCRKCRESAEAAWPAETNARMKSQCHRLMEGMTEIDLPS